MNSLQLLNSTFKRVSNFIEAHNFKLRRLSNGDYAFYLNHPDSKLHNYDWAWDTKKELLLGNDNDNVYSLFDLICRRKNFYDTLNKPIEFFSENELKFIDICRYLKDCSCLEELVIKMDLMGI